MDKANLAHCHYLMGLSAIGINDRKRALKKFEEVLRIDGNHQMAKIYKERLLKKLRTYLI